TVLVRTTQLETPIPRRLFGYQRGRVRDVLRVSAAQLARLHNEISQLQVENDNLRGRILLRLSDPPSISPLTAQEPVSQHPAAERDDDRSPEHGAGPEP
ncbi:MAG: hypothetical protein LC798_20370, partial [Chloroflexi bacterium]|nr:hypothetical protein [Chloroflexota bacterium]